MIKRRSNNKVERGLSRIMVYIFFVLILIIFVVIYINNYNNDDGYSLIAQHGRGIRSEGSRSINNIDIPILMKEKYIVSYVMYAPYSSSKKNKKVYETCIENVDIFVSRAVVESDNVDYVFILPGETYQTSKLQYASLLSNVKVIKVKNDGVDILSHLKLLQSLQQSYGYYILLNCGSRGPYYDGKLPSLSWMAYFTSKLTEDRALVGPTISMEISPHVQTYALAFSKNSSQLIIDYWSQFTNLQYSNRGYDSEDRMKLILKLEVGLSDHILKQNWNIASIDSRYDSIDFRKHINQNSNYSKYINPTRCEVNSINSIGCEGLEPCEVLFVKYGGEIIQNNAISPITKKRLNSEDNAVSTCQNFIEEFYRPKWDANSHLKNISIFNRHHHTYSAVDLVFIVRVYSQFKDQLLSMLFTLEAYTSDLNVQVFLIPTDSESVDIIKEVLVKQWYFDSVSHHIRVSLVEFPSSIYMQYGSYIDTICTESWKSKALKVYHAGFIGRFCNVNSPLHYLLVDILLEYVKNKLKISSYWIIITNADNYYFPQFFNHLSKWKNINTIDVLMVNMIHNGILFPTSFEKSKTDLGSYAVKSSFLFNTNASFLNSLPIRCNPIHYHEADGHFLENIKALNAKTMKIEDYNFAHN